MHLNRTQELIWRDLQSSCITGDELLLEALLCRGFLAYRDVDGLWLGTGSHAADALVLELVPGLEVMEVPQHRDRYCKISPVEATSYSLEEIAWTVIALSEHHVGSEIGGFSCFGLGYNSKHDYTWRNYYWMSWGAQVAVCPAKSLSQSPVQDALDIGIALLVKSLPLAGVVTKLSCDGHGIKPAIVSFCFDWDACWAQAVFSALVHRPIHSEWEWGTDLRIHPMNGYGDESVTLMLDDIQQCARQFLDIDLIGKIGRVRRDTLNAFSCREPGPSIQDFGNEACTRLENEFG
jgi:hypothetical protein